MNLSAIIAENLKRLRLERNLSLGQLAQLSNVSKVMLSQIEKGDTNPTINTIWKIAVTRHPDLQQSRQEKLQQNIFIKATGFCMKTKLSVVIYFETIL